MLREVVVSEALHALGIPTTRSLAVATTGEVVMRSTPLPGAVLTRVAASHIRVGTFQYAAALGRHEVLGALLDHAIARHDPKLADLDAGDRPAPLLEQLESGLLLAAGHYRNGVLLAPASAAWVAEQIANEQIASDLVSAPRTGG